MNHIVKVLGAVLITLFCLSGITLAQERAQADVQVRSMVVTEAADRLTCRFEVFSVNDDDAHDTTVRILFPVGVMFISSATGCTAPPSIASDRTQAVAMCEIGVLRHRGGRGESRTMEVVTTVPRRELRVSKTFAAFAWSLTPDPQPRNNYGEATAISIRPPVAPVPSVRAEITRYSPTTCISKGGPVTILGVGFGNDQETKRAVVGGRGISVVLPITDWSNRRITATLPNDARLRVGQTYYIGIQNSEGNWISNINRAFTVCR